MISTIRVDTSTKYLIMKLMKPQESYEQCIVRVFKYVLEKEQGKL